jgi:hypothetical protein
MGTWGCLSLILKKNKILPYTFLIQGDLIKMDQRTQLTDQDVIGDDL